MAELPPHTHHALAVIEFGKVLDLVAGHAVSPCGAERIQQSRPRGDPSWITMQLHRVRLLREFVGEGERWRVRSVPDVRPALRRLAVLGAHLEGTELRDVATILASSRLCLSQLCDSKRSPELREAIRPITALLLSEPAAERVIERAIAEDGSVLDNATGALKRIRRDLMSHKQSIVSLLERIAGSLEPHQRVADGSVTIRDGRYVIPVRREAKGSVGGIVHDTSASGATLFIEPPAAVEHSNRIRELESDERREVERILRELTDGLRPMEQRLADTLDSLTELDSLFARALFAQQCGGARFEVGNAVDGFAVRDGRHPLLVAQGIEVVPFTLELLPENRTLLISGPNTGGKTVLLKSVALLSAMAQAGVPAPVGEGSRLAIFDEFFADVGDEQSIQASLSTFSAHLRNISGILQHATRNSLVLIDEIGSGTDPVEGAALAAAVLEELTVRGTTTLATTHLGALQRLATELPGVVNGSLQFDSSQLAPTYHFIKGIPGRSYGLSIARRLGLPAAIVENAEQRVPEGDRQLTALIASLEERGRELVRREERASADANNIAARTQLLEEREAGLQERQKEFERESRRQARRHLLDSREDVERTIRELRAAAAGEVEAAAHEARRHIEGLAAEHDTRLRELDGVAEPQRRTAGGAVVPGDAVLVGSLGGREGIALEIRGDTAVVAVGALKASVPLASLSKRGAPSAPKEVVTLRGALPEENASGEIDIRGMRFDEVEGILIPALDAASRADLHLFRVIHGKGKGTLRGRVQELLRGDSRVSSFRDGAWNEGGIGVTIVELS